MSPVRQGPGDGLPNPVVVLNEKNRSHASTINGFRRPPTALRALLTRPYPDRVDNRRVMKKRFGLLAAWLLATTLAVGVASQAVGLVADRAVEIPAQVPVALGDQSSIGPITAPPGRPPTSIATTTTTSTIAGAPTDSTAPGATSSTTSSTITAAPSTTTTSPPPLDSRTYYLPGGQVSVACTGSETIKLLSTSPAPGWRLELESSGPEKVRVDFESGEEEAESEIEIVCQNGRLNEDISD